MAEKNDCPFWKGPCKEHECRLYIQVLGANPNTGEQMNKWDCSFAWLPILAIETSQQTRQTGASVDSLRNEIVRLQEASLQLQLFEAKENGIMFIRDS